jgi:4-amino-4-deoxy-L-arabinose transferase-like glycosyltransferase
VTRQTRWALGGLAALTLVRLLAAAYAPLSPDEAYYWVWSRALAAGYLDHPPMVALWIRLGTAIAGPTPLGVRLLAPLSGAVGAVLLWQAARDLLGPGPAGLRAALLLNAMLLFGVGAVTMTPDTPLLFFWTAGLWAMARLIATGRAGWWWAVGAACGLALFSKYTAVLLPGGIGLWLLVARGQWRWLRRPQPWGAAVLALGLFAPVVWWNALHGWVSFAKQGGRNFVFHPARAAGFLGELMAGQAGLVTPLIFVLCVAGAVMVARRAARERDAGDVLLAALILPSVALFVEHALGDRVQPNWPAILYPAAAIAACLAAPRLFRALFVPGLVLGFALTAVVYAQSALALFALPVGLDPTLRLSGGFAGLAQAASALAVQKGASFVAADDYGPAALLAFDAPACGSVIALGPRWTLFALPDGRQAMAGRRGLLLRSTHRHTPPSMRDWASLAAIGTLSRSRGGEVAETYTVFEGIGRDGSEGAALLPCRPAN